jgi:hypothetical protein
MKQHVRVGARIVAKAGVAVAAAALLGGCAALPQGHLRSGAAASVNPLELVCVKTNDWEPCRQIRRSDLKFLPGWRTLLGIDVPGRS